MSPNEDAVFREALDRSAKVVSGLPELLQPSAFSIVFPLIYAPNSRRSPLRKGSRPSTATSQSAPRRQSSGPKAALETLRSEGFFGVARTVEELAKEIKDSRGQVFEGRMLSTALLRMLRAGELERSRTAAGDYAYMEAK